MTSLAKLAGKPRLSLDHHFGAPPSDVFRAWTEPQHLAMWFGPAGAKVLNAACDPQAGGDFSLRFRTPDGQEREVSGRYREVTAEQRLAFTWTWNHRPDQESLVTVVLVPDAGGTRLSLVHEPLFSEGAYSFLSRGWASSFDKLETLLAGLTYPDVRFRGPLRFDRRDAIRFVGLRESHCSCGDNGVPAQWLRFAPHIGHIPGEIAGMAYSICLPISGDSDRFDYMAAVAVSGPALPPMGLTVFELPALRYAVFEHLRHISQIPDTIGAIRTEWLPGAGVTVRSSPAFIECYGEAFDPFTGQGGIEIWVPLGDGS